MMKSAVIGTGLIASIHAQALTSLGHTIAVAVNPHVAGAERFASQWHAERYSADLEDAFGENIDCVHICTPPVMHAYMIRQALLAGRHVICEKPLCLSEADAWEMSELAEQKGLVNAVGFNSRCYGAVQQIRQMIKEGELGRILLVHGAYQQEYHALPDVYSWRYQPDKAGDMRAVTEIGSHWFDLAMYLTGMKIDAVSSVFGCFAPERVLKDNMMYRPEAEKTDLIQVDTEDAASISLKFSNGALGSVLLSEVSHGRGNQLTIEIIGTKKSVWWNSEHPGTVNTGEKGKGMQVTQNDFNGGYPDTFKTLFSEVYADIAAGHPSRSHTYPTFADGAENTSVCRAVYQSARNQSVWTKVLGGSEHESR